MVRSECWLFTKLHRLHTGGRRSKTRLRPRCLTWCVPNPADVHPLLEGWIQNEIAVDLFRRAGLDFNAEKKRAQSEDFTPVPLAESTLSVDFLVEQKRVVSKNVVGLLRGATHPAETVIYTAHWDHLGVGGPDASGDRIYNGARDNALGVAALLELARAFATEPRPERSMVFLALTAEEKGLLGSLDYTHHPLYRTDLNGCCHQHGWRKCRRSVAGCSHRRGRQDYSRGRLSSGSTAARPALLTGSTTRNRFVFCSDHFSFAKIGVPAISFRPGDDLLDGGIPAGKAAKDEYIAKRYHQASDEWLPSWDLRGEVMSLSLLHGLGRTLANSRNWPAWQEGSEFKAILRKDRIRS